MLHVTILMLLLETFHLMFQFSFFKVSNLTIDPLSQ